jgi:hypothetical protein
MPVAINPSMMLHPQLLFPSSCWSVTESQYGIQFLPHYFFEYEISGFQRRVAVTLALLAGHVAFVGSYLLNAT